MNHISNLHGLNAMIDGEVFGARGEWEKHEIGGHTTFVKAIGINEPEIKAHIASRYDELGFVPVFFKESGREFVALEGIKETTCYHTVEEAFIKQILTRLG